MESCRIYCLSGLRCSPDLVWPNFYQERERRSYDYEKRHRFDCFSCRDEEGNADLDNFRKAASSGRSLASYWKSDADKDCSSKVYSMVRHSKDGQSLPRGLQGGSTCEG